MKIYTKEEMLDLIRDSASTWITLDLCNQVCLKTGIYLWRDGTYRDEQESNLDDRVL